MADGGACATEIVLYCGQPLLAGAAGVYCFVRVSDGLVVRVPNLATEKPTDGSIRECTPDENERTRGNDMVLCT
ncbi:MAG: hypothetical protein U0169_26550 [Polyangiaceae bacterium]